jgi:hypothetical protein
VGWAWTLRDTDIAISTNHRLLLDFITFSPILVPADCLVVATRTAVETRNRTSKDFAPFHSTNYRKMFACLGKECNWNCLTYFGLVCVFFAVSFSMAFRSDLVLLPTRQALKVRRRVALVVLDVNRVAAKKG